MKKKNKQYQVSFFPNGVMEDFLSEMTLWVDAENEEEAKKQATAKLVKEDRLANYRKDSPMVVKVS
jgi:hypothetical protein